MLWIIVDRHHQAYHDKIAGTFVVHGVKHAAGGAAPVEVVTLRASRRLRVAKWAGFIIASYVTLAPSYGLVVAQVGVSRAERQASAILAQLKAEGKPIRAADLAPPPVPDAENAALVYEEAFQKLDLAKQVDEVLSKVVTNWQCGLPLGHELTAQELETLATGKSSAQSPSAPPPGVNAPPGERSIITPDPSMKVERNPKEPTDAEVLTASRKALERNRDALALIHRAAAMDKCRFDIDWSKGMGAVPFPLMTQLRQTARLLRYEAMVLCEEGDADGALRAAVTATDLAGAIRDMPTLLPLLVRVVISNMGAATTEGVLFDSSPSPSACRAFEVRLAGVEFNAAGASALEGERAVVLDLMEKFRTSTDPVGLAISEFGITNPKALHALRRVLATVPLHRWWLGREEMFWLEGMAVHIELMKLPFFERESSRGRQLRHTLADLEQRPPFPPATLAAIFLGFYDRVAERDATAQGFVGLARTALLLKAYRGERGRYPASLDELERYVGKQLPLDPCSGKRFHYRLEGTGFILYSVGADGTDDGGKVAVRTGQEGPIPPLWSRESGSDIVWVCKR